MEEKSDNIAGWIVFFLVISALTTKRVIQIIKTKPDFKKALLPKAKSLEVQTGIPADFAIGQAGLESGWGQSLLAREGKNLFGMMAGSDWIKAYSGKAPFDNVAPWTSLPASSEGNSKIPAGRNVIWMLTKEFSTKPAEQIQFWDVPGDVVGKTSAPGGTWLTIRRAFRQYANFDESLNDWAKKISTWSRYSKAYAAAKAGDAKTYGQALKEGGYATDPKYPEKILASIQTAQGIPTEATA